MDFRPPNPVQQRLNAADVASPSWQKIKAHAERELFALRQQNDSPLNTEAETAVLRGRIVELKRLLALGEQ